MQVIRLVDHTALRATAEHLEFVQLQDWLQVRSASMHGVYP
jgi:hypothetical protein